MPSSDPLKVLSSSQPTAESALQKTVPGILLNDAQGNSFNYNVQFRGFEASPVNGFAQGLSVYQNGVRINESFGDVVNFDAIPSVAISSMSVMGGNPVYGLNAIGGSLNIVMKDGFQFQGVEIDTRFGSNDRRQGSLQAGMRAGQWAAYIATELIEDGGYRNYSESSVKRMYADLGFKNEGTEIHLSYTGAKNNFGVAAATPIQMLNIDRKLTLTTPQTTNNDINMVQLNATTKVTPNLQLAGVVYGRIFKQDHVDGNVAAFRKCGTLAQGYEAASPNLCSGEDDSDPAITGFKRSAIRDSKGNLIKTNDPRIVALNGNAAGATYGWGTTDRTSQDAQTFGGTVQATDKSKLFGLPNQFTVGFSYDHGSVDYASSSELGVSDKTLVVKGTGIFLGGDFAARNITTTNDYIGLFFSNTLDLTDRLALTVGGRYNFAKIQLEDHTGNFPDLNASHTYERFNPMVGATYKLIPGLSLYGSYSEANRAPTASELGCADPNNPCVIESFLAGDPPLKQVVSHTVEAGFKGELNSVTGSAAQLNWSLGVFYALNTDDIISVLSETQGRGYFINAGDTQRQGIEASLVYKTERLSAYVGYSYTDATFQSNLSLGPNNNNWAPVCSFDDEAYCPQVKPGNKLPGVSPHKVKLGAEYAILPQWKFGADWTWASSQYYYGDEGNNAPQVGPRSRVDLHTTYDVTKNLQFYGLVNNVFNNRYDVFGTYYSGETAYKTAGQPPSLSVINTNRADQRSLVPAAPLELYGGVKFKF